MRHIIPLVYSDTDPMEDPIPVIAHPINESLDVIAEQQILPLITAPFSEHVRFLPELLEAHKMPAVEVTLRTPSSLRIVAELSRRSPRLVIGAGSVTSPAQVEEAAAAGARFVVSPGYSDAVVAAARVAGVAPLPGVATPTEMQHALESGLDMVKLFPAEQLGGVRFIDAIAAPLPGLRFVPSGGISRDLLGDYLARANVAAAGCSWVLPNSAFSSERPREALESSIASADATRAAARQ